MNIVDRDTPHAPAALGRPAMEYGLIIGLVLILVSCLPFITPMEMNGWPAKLLTWTVMLGGIILMLQHFRDKRNHGQLSFGRGMGLSALTGVFAGLIQAVFVFILFKYIDPSLADRIMEKAVDEMELKGQTQEQIQMGLKFMSYTMKPPVLALISIFGSVMSFVFFGLIGSAIVKK